jgi:hypothetical protein
MSQSKKTFFLSVDDAQVPTKLDLTGKNPSKAKVAPNAKVAPKAKGTVAAAAAKKGAAAVQPAPKAEPAAPARTSDVVGETTASSDLVPIAQVMKTPAKSKKGPTSEAKAQANNDATKSEPVNKQSEAPARKPVHAATGLEAAVKVLSEHGQPMSCRDLVSKMIGSGLWTTSGKTPTATINASLHKEIKTKGAASRFAKTGRGLFTLNTQKGA